MAVSTVEAGQTITRLDLTVGNLSNGAAEQLTIDGTTFSLTNGATGTTATNTVAYSVSVASSTATVTLTKVGGVSAAAMQTLVDGIAYRNTSQDPTAGARVVTLTRIDDSGSNTAPNDNTATLSLASTVTVVAVNDQPTLTATAVSPTFTEDGAAVDLFNGVSVATVEAGQTVTRLDLTVANLGNGAAEQLTIDGTTFSLTNGATGTTATNGMTYTVTVAGSTATVTLTRAAGVSVANMQALVDGIAYQNTSQAPAGATRTVTLTRIDDSGSNTAPNDNTATLAIASTVTIAAVNDAPVNTVPGAQATFMNTSLVFSSGNGNLISVADPDAATVQVALTVTNGTLTLSGTGGLTFNAGANGTATMTFTGTQAAVNAAIAGMSYAPTTSYTGPASLSITTSDLGSSGSGGTLTDSDVVAITVAPSGSGVFAADDTAATTEDAPSRSSPQEYWSTTSTRLGR